MLSCEPNDEQINYWFLILWLFSEIKYVFPKGEMYLKKGVIFCGHIKHKKIIP